jgi:AraC-like DNA-binding protein
MINKKPALEKVIPGFGESIKVMHNQEMLHSSKAFWHFHPEVELVYVNKGQGKRHIGNHLSYFNNSQLILIGANLAHNGFSNRLTAQGSETLIQFNPEIFGNTFIGLPEMKDVNLLLERAKKGILFKRETKERIGTKIQSMYDLGAFSRIVTLLEIMYDLAQAEDYELLNSDGFAFEAGIQDNEKIEVIYKYININFQQHITLDEIANEVSMTVPAFCRYFKKVTGKTFTKLVNEYRIVHATKLLSESQQSVTDICFACGFNNFSHFNKIFKEITGKSASKYRGELKKLIH